MRTQRLTVCIAESSLQKLSEEEENLRIATTSIQVKDKIICELKSTLSGAERDSSTADVGNSKLKRSLNVAMVTVKSLQVSRCSCKSVFHGSVTF